MNLQALNREIVACRRCPRLVEWREQVARTKRSTYRQWEYWGKPVPGFGDEHARVMAVGLAPGAHGSNRTGRMFTGDASGDFLYRALFRTGFANRPVALRRDDGLALKDLYITAVCRCVPPQNKPNRQELANCQPYLLKEIDLIKPRIFVALGRISFDSLIHILDVGSERPVFRHGAVYECGDHKTLVCSYHPSRQNTQTGRLTESMFDRVWETVKDLLRN